MKTITKRGIFLWILCALFIVGIVFMTVSLGVNSDDWVMKRYNKHVYSDGELVGAGTIYDTNGKVLAQTIDGDRKYADSKSMRKATLHTVGDPKNFIQTSIQSVYDSTLTGYNFVDGVYNIKKNGKGSDMTLTIDGDICDVAYKALGDKKGTVGVVNYKTGEIVCMVSTPTFDVYETPKDIEKNEKYEGVYINRLLTAHYVPGSTFKIVTAICAIENIPDIYNRTFECTGAYQPSEGIEIKCNAKHGKIDFETALAKSCNSVFSQLAIELGEDKLNETAKRLGIGSTITVDGKIKAYKGKFDVKGVSEDKLGWTGIGQGDTRIAPITMLRIVSAIANDGVAPNFKLVKSIENQKLPSVNLQSNTQIMDTNVASQMTNLLRNNVINHYGDNKYKGLNLCAKSGTAQIDEVDAHNIAWFTGFMDDDNNPYAFVVAVENGNSGSKTAGPIANKVLQAIVNDGK